MACRTRRSHVAFLSSPFTPRVEVAFVAPASLDGCVSGHDAKAEVALVIYSISKGAAAW